VSFPLASECFPKQGKPFIFGAVAQLEERVVRNDEVGSSNLLGSTISGTKKPAKWRAFKDRIARSLKLIVQADEVLVSVGFYAVGVSSIRVGETRPESMPVLEGYVDFVTEVV
jgi:hypothetical protein